MWGIPKGRGIRSIKNMKNKKQKCGDKCEYAIGEHCECDCGGKNHGRVWRGAKEKANERNTVVLGKKTITPEKSLELINHSPDGFMWGYGGSGPAQLALAILLEYLSQEKAQKYHQQFKWEVIAKLDKEQPFVLDEKVVKDWIKMNVK